MADIIESFNKFRDTTIYGNLLNDSSGSSYIALTTLKGNVNINGNINLTSSTSKIYNSDGTLFGNEYLNKTDAVNTYFTITDASNNYLKKTDAISTYLSKTDATSTYLTQNNADLTYSKISSSNTFTGTNTFSNITTNYLTINNLVYTPLYTPPSSGVAAGDLDSSHSGFINMNTNITYNIYLATRRPYVTLTLFNNRSDVSLPVHFYTNTTPPSYGLFGIGYSYTNNVTVPVYGCMTIYSNGLAWCLISKTF